MVEIVTSSRLKYRHPKAVVSIATRLQDGLFSEVPYLRAERLRIVAGPEIDQCQLTYIYGNILREDSAGPATSYYTPQDLNGKFVKVVITDTVYADAFALDPATTETDESITWFGVIEFDERITAGTTPAPQNHAQGVQSITAFGLMRLLEKEVVRTSIVDIDGTEANAFTSRCGLPFNVDGGGQFIQRGNRSTTKITDAGMVDLTYVFSWEPRGKSNWTAYTAMQYLLANHTPLNSDGDPANVWRLDGDADYLDWYEITEKTDGRTVKSLVDALIPRFRGVGYWCWFDIERTDPEDPATAANVIVIETFTFNKTNVTLPNTQILKANANQRSLNFESAFDIEEALVGNTSMQTYHRVIARGAKRTTTFTTAISSNAAVDSADILIPSWTSLDETEYKDGASGEADYASLTLQQQQQRNAIYRASSDRLREVWRRFVLNPNVGASRWNGRIIRPHTASPGSSIYWLRGDITADPFTALYDSLSAYDGRDYVPSLRVMRGLPLYERYDYSGTKLADFVYGTAFTDQTHPSYIPLMAYVRTKTGDAEFSDLTGGQTPHRYELLDRLQLKAFSGDENRDWACRIHVLDTQPGVEITADCPHFLAGADAGSGAGWAATASDQLGSEHGAIDYTQIHVTMCVELTEHAEQAVVLTQPAEGAPENVKIINVPDARHDYVLPYTTVEIKDGIPIQTTSGGAAKDDLARLLAIATTAAEWYSTVRQTLRLRWKQIRGTFRPGWLITDVGGTYQITDINTPITAITYDLGGEHQPGQTTTGGTTIETAFAELDFQ